MVLGLWRRIKQEYSPLKLTKGVAELRSEKAKFMCYYNYRTPA